MYKSKLQVLCQKNSWALPEYSTIRDGPDHNARFSATVTVNGLPFATLDQSRSAKEAQNKAAQLAFDHFSAPVTNPNAGPSQPLPITAPSNFPVQSSPSGSGSAASLKNLNVRPSIGGTSQPTMMEKIGNPVVNETPLRVKDGNEFIASLKNLNVRPSIGGTSQPTMIEKIGNPVVNETPLRVKDGNEFIGSAASLKNLNVRPSIGGTSQPTMIEKIGNPVVNETPLRVKDGNEFIDVKHLYKNLLQNYAQKRNITLPEYSYEREGPPHASRFRSIVTFDGKTYESLQFFSTLKEAEQAAAKFAWESLSLDDVQEDDSGIYKSLLQELAQKNGFRIPKYETTASGPPHLPIFVSTVEIGDQSFKGQAAKSKKQAEMNAAKVAYTGLQERRASAIPTVLPPQGQIKEALNESSSILQSVITSHLQGRVKPKATHVTSEQQDGKEKILSSKPAAVSAQVSSFPPPEAYINAEGNYRFSSSDSVYANLRDPFPSTSSLEEGSSSPSALSECSTNSSVESNSEPVGSSNTLPRTTVLVCPRTPNMTFPEGATVLPFSDDKWVALKMN